MKDYIRKRVLDICQHILVSKNTVRQAATVFSVSKSTVHKDILKVNGGNPQVKHFIIIDFCDILINAEISLIS